jgi:hypothetical protein
LRRQQSFNFIAITILSISVLGGLFWANLRFTRIENGGNDLAIYWTSARTLLYDDATPYGELASLKSQYLIYGLAGRKGDPPSRLDLPFHIETYILPLGIISDYQTARAVWMTFLEISLVVSVFISLRSVRWIPNPVVGAGLFLFAIFTVYGLWVLILGNAVVVSVLLLAGALLALRENHDELTGILLALATFKFLTVGFFLIFILFWAMFQRRWRIFFPFIMTLVILIAVSFFFFSNWFLPYLRAVFTNLKFGGWLTPGIIFKDALPFVGEKLGWVLSGLMVIVLLLEWWLARKMEFHRMIWAASLTIAITPLLGLPAYPQNYIVLLIPLILCFSVISDRWDNSGSMMIVGILVFLFVGLWLIAIYALNKTAALFFPLPVFVICLLYWVRWWAIVAPRSRIESINP